MSLGSALHLHVALYLNDGWHCSFGANGALPGSLETKRKTRQRPASPGETAVHEGVIPELQDT